MFLGHLVDLRAKAGGEKSMPEKREPLEDAEGAVPQDPRDTAKAELPESQSPAVETHTRCSSACNAASPRGRPFAFCGLPLPTGRAIGSEPIEGDGWDAYVTLDTFSTDGTRDGLTGASPRVTESP
jgi:hypothetical protein